MIKGYKMITIFTIPKPFNDPHINAIQRNAIKSWTLLEPTPEIIVFGDDQGVKEVAEEFGLVHINDVKKNQYGTPTLDFVFEKAQQISKNDILCYVNADIIFTSDLISAINKINFKNFLLVGRRNDLDIEDINFEEQNWESKLRDDVKNKGILHDPNGIDYFIFNKGSVINMPALAVGRRGWDNWFIYNMRKSGIPVVDITGSSLVIHQNHSYNHVPERKGDRWEGPESDINIKLIGGKRSHLYCFTIIDADWSLVNGRLERKTQMNFLGVYRKMVLITPATFHGVIDLVFRLQHKIRYFNER